MRIAHVIPYIARDFGGPVIAMAAMVDCLIYSGERVAVFTVHDEREGVPVDLPKATDLTLCQDLSWGGLRHSADLWSAFGNANMSVIHSHGLWTDVHRCAALTARRKGVPHILGPCGMLDEDALRRSWWKKRIASFVFQSQALKEASCLLANSEKEYEDIRLHGLTNPVAIVPNPVPAPDFADILSHEELKERYPVLSARKTLLFLGRIHPVKGLERLISAWAQLSTFHGDWQLVLAGPDEGGYRATLEAQIDRLHCRSSVHLIGTLDNRCKWAVLQAAELFVMPSDFENFGMSIVEAMLVEKPVITTTGTPWQSLVDHGAGWWVERTMDALKDALVEAMTLPDEDRQAMGRRGCGLASHFTPDIVASQLIALYRWLLKQGERPDFVRLD